MNENAVIPDLEEDEGTSSQDAEIMEALKPSKAVDDDRNWALDESVIAYVSQHVYPILAQARMDMIPLHEEWKAIARMGTLTHDSHQKYIGRSNVYIPSYAKARKTLVKAIMQGLFPSDEYMNVTDRERPSDAEAPNAGAVKTYLQWEFEKNAQVKKNLKPFVGEFIDYGYAVAKFWYDKPTRGFRQGRLKINAQGMTQDEYKSVARREGLRLSTRSVYDFYVYPYNINDLSEASIVFEDIDVTKGFIRERGRTKEWENIDQALDSIDSDGTHTDSQQERQYEQMGNVNNSSAFADSDIGAIRMVTEIWCDLLLPKSAYMADEEQVPVPCKLVMTGDVILQCVRNPFWFQTHPYLVCRDDPKPGNFFSKGTGKLVQGLQYVLNDFTNQMNDNMIMGLNPMVLYNPSTMAGPLTPFKPGGTWATTDVANGIKFDRPPVEQVQYAQGLVQLYAGMMADHAGAPPVLQGSKGAGTATATQILARNAANPLKDTIEDMENDILNPLMFACWILGQQYRSSEYMIEVMGDTGGWDPKSQNKSALCGDFLFRWLASSQAANAAQRAEQAIKIVQVMSPPVVQLLMQQGWVVDLQPLLKRLYQDALGYRDFDKFIKRAPPVIDPSTGQPMPPGMLPPGGSMGGPPAPPPGGGSGGQPPPSQTNDVRSAATQANNPHPNANQMVEGEGDVLGPIRQMVERQTGEQEQ